MMYITYKYRLRPNKIQRGIIDKTIKYANMVRDLCVTNNEQELARQSAKKLVDKYISKYPELKECDFSALMNSIFDIMNEEVKYISTRESYSTTYSDFLRNKFPINKRRVYLPKVGWVCYRRHRPVPDLRNIIKMIVKKDALDRYYLYLDCISYESERRKLDLQNSVGIDYSSTYFLVDSNGQKYPVEHFYRNIEKERKQLQRKLSQKKPGSLKYRELEKKIIKMEQKVSNKRRDTLHKISAQLAEKYDYVFVETLNLKEMAKTSHLSKATYDNSYSLFLELLQYKMKKKGGKVVKINKWFPSSKTCNCCGYINKDLQLSTKEWKCPTCGMVHDRDINAAINLRKEGIRYFSAG